MLSRFHLIPERHGRTGGQTDGRTDRIAISMTRDKNRHQKPISDASDMQFSTDFFWYQFLITNKTLYFRAGLW